MNFATKILLLFLPFSLTSPTYRQLYTNEHYIIGGKEAVGKSWPWQVGLIREGSGVICGGAILSPNWILTAAHCVYHKNKCYLTVFAGIHNLMRSEHVQVKDVKKIIVHSHWSQKTLNNDVALVKIEPPLKLTKYIQRIFLPSEDVKDGSECYITGWGSTKVGLKRTTDKLQEARVTVVSQKTCHEFNKHLGTAVTDKMVCVGYGPERRQASCKGDSGSPLSCKSSEGVWELQGTDSWGADSCSTKHGYSVYARTSSFIKWIKENTNLS